MTSPVTITGELMRRTLAGVEPSSLLLASDFDGTLAEIVPRPEDATGRPESLRALAELVPLLRKVAVVSGRSRAALAAALPVPGLTLIGDYGLEAPDAAEREALSRFNSAAAGIVAGLAGARLESKPGSSSIHFRRAPELRMPLLEAVAPLAASLGLRSGEGRMVIEVRPFRAGKGATVGRLVEELDPGAVIFAGDDEGDGDAFEYVGGLRIPHLTLGIASPESPAGLFDACDAVLDGPAQMGEVLIDLARWASRPGREDPGADG
ncbi:MAG: trehalose-phosphatase [Candidatus Dormibacteraceae bacterium]